MSATLATSSSLQVTTSTPSDPPVRVKSTCSAPGSTRWMKASSFSSFDTSPTWTSSRRWTFTRQRRTAASMARSPISIDRATTVPNAASQ